MRVLHLGKYFPPVAGGIERFLGELTREQQRQGLQPMALAHGARSSESIVDGVPVRRVRSLGELLFVPISPSWPFALHSAISTWRPDLLHIHAPNASALWLLASRAAKRVPWVVHWHADVPLDTHHRGLTLAYPAYERLERALLRRSARIIASSESYMRASQPLSAFAERCRVVPLGLAHAPAADTTPVWPQGRLRVLAVGRMSYYKGFRYLIEALAAVPEASLLLIGDGAERAEITRLIERQGLQSRVHLAGSVGDGQLEAAYRDCDVFCLPSIDRAEAFGMVLLEAMRSAKPVIASDVPGSGMGSVVQDGVTGLLVPPKSPTALADALRRLIAEPSLGEQLGKAGQARFHQHYRIEPVAAAITGLYREVLAER